MSKKPAAGRPPSYRVCVALNDDVSSVAALVASVERVTRLGLGNVRLPDRHMHVRLAVVPLTDKAVEGNAVLAAYSAACPEAWMVRFFGGRWAPAGAAAVGFRDAVLEDAVERKDDCLVFVGPAATPDGVYEAVRQIGAGKEAWSCVGVYAAAVAAFGFDRQEEMDGKQVTRRVADVARLRERMKGW